MRLVQCTLSSAVAYKPVLAAATAINEKVMLRIEGYRTDEESQKLYLSPSESLILAKQILAACKTANTRTRKSIDRATPKEPA